MLITKPPRVLVAIHDDAARKALMENLTADGHDPKGASSIGHARSHLKQQVDVLIVELDAGTVHLIDAIRGASARLLTSGFRSSPGPRATTCSSRCVCSNAAPTM
jgi:DNA-binding NtrC family response regulator